MEMETRAVFMAQSTEDAAEKRKSFLEKRPPAFAPLPHRRAGPGDDGRPGIEG